MSKTLKMDRMNPLRSALRFSRLQHIRVRTLRFGLWLFGEGLEMVEKPDCALKLVSGSNGRFSVYNAFGENAAVFAERGVRATVKGGRVNQAVMLRDVLRLCLKAFFGSGKLRQLCLRSSSGPFDCAGVFHRSVTFNQVPFPRRLSHSSRLRVSPVERHVILRLPRGRHISDVTVNDPKSPYEGCLYWKALRSAFFASFTASLWLSECRWKARFYRRGCPSGDVWASCASLCLSGLSGGRCPSGMDVAGGKAAFPRSPR